MALKGGVPLSDTCGVPWHLLDLWVLGILAQEKPACCSSGAMPCPLWDTLLCLLPGLPFSVTLEWRLTKPVAFLSLGPAHCLIQDPHTIRDCMCEKNFNKNKQFRRSGGQAGGRADCEDSVLFLAGEAQEALLGTSFPKTNTVRQARFVFLPLMVEHPG